MSLFLPEPHVLHNIQKVYCNLKPTDIRSARGKAPRLTLSERESRQCMLLPAAVLASTCCFAPVSSQNVRGWTKCATGLQPQGIFYQKPLAYLSFFFLPVDKERHQLACTRETLLNVIFCQGSKVTEPEPNFYL